MLRKTLAATAAALVAAALTLPAFAADQTFLADRHVAKGLKCESCHGTGAKDAVSKETCLKCHGGSYAALAKTTDGGDINPHETHLGEPECNQCHSGHKKPRLICDQCHEFDMRVP